MADDVAYLQSLKETEQIELKECSNKVPLSFYETYCAMANGSGGYIYLGITEGEIVNTINGVENAPQKVKQLCNSLTTKSKIVNNIFSTNDISIIKTEYGDVIKVRVNPSPINQRPVYLNGDLTCSYKRVYEGDKLLSEEEIQSMVNDSNKVKFDQRPNDFGFSLDDTDNEAIQLFVSFVKNIGKITSSEEMNTEDILSRVGAMVFDKEKNKLVLTNGAVLFFGKSYAVNSVCPSLWLDYQEKMSESNRFTNRITIKELAWEPNIYNFFRHVFPRICELLPSPFYLENGINVGKKFLEEIVREAIANSISNMELNSAIGLLIVKTASTLFLRNSGGLLTGMEQALKGGVSIPRNPCIFNFFLALGITDHGGYGIPNIFEKMKMLKMPIPELKESWNRDETSLLLNFVQLSNALTIDEQKVVAFLALNPYGVSSSAIANYLSCSNETARQILLRLIVLGEAMDNGKSNKGRLYYPTEKDYKTINGVRLKIQVCDEIRNNPNYQANDLYANDINSILVKTRKELKLYLDLISDNSAERHDIVRRPSVGYCAMEMDGLHDYSPNQGFIASNVDFIGINRYVIRKIKTFERIVILDDNDEPLITIELE